MLLTVSPLPVLTIYLCILEYRHSFPFFVDSEHPTFDLVNASSYCNVSYLFAVLFCLFVLYSSCVYIYIYLV